VCPQTTWTGARPGFFFGNGRLGMGYYQDRKGLSLDMHAQQMRDLSQNRRAKLAALHARQRAALQS
jgi:hypothetical protein